MHFSQRTRLPIVLVMAAVFTVWAGVATSLAQADSSPEVIGDDQRDVFVGTGSLLLPARISTPGRSSAANCPGCTWRAVLTCDRTSAGACRGAARTCPMDSAWLTLYLTRPGQDEQWLGSACFGPGGPARRTEVEARVNERLEQAVPALTPQVSPPSNALVTLPLRFSSGQSGASVSWTWEVIGITVQGTATPRWHWRFGIGSDVITTNPGALSAVGAITHTYVESGNYRVQVLATWQGEYTADGLGPLAVEQPVRQRGELTVQVGQGRAVLVR